MACSSVCLLYCNADLFLQPQPGACMWKMHNECHKDGWITLALVCVLFNLLSTEVIWCLLSCSGFLPITSLKPGDSIVEWWGEAAAGGTTGKWNPLQALLLSNHKWGDERKHGAREASPWQSGQPRLIAHSLYLLAVSPSSAHSFIIKTNICWAPTMYQPVFQQNLIPQSRKFSPGIV